MHWAPAHAASYLINRACKQLSSGPWKTEKGVVRPPAYIVIAYSDVEAGEVGTVFQASNWSYCGPSAGTTMYRERLPNGWSQWKDTKQIHASTRIRQNRSIRPDETGRRFFEFKEWPGKFYSGDTLPDGSVIKGEMFPYLQTMSRADRVRQLKAAGAQFKEGTAKGRYVGIFGDKRVKRAITKALLWERLPYPKRAGEHQDVPLVPPTESQFEPADPLQN